MCAIISHEEIIPESGYLKSKIRRRVDKSERKSLQKGRLNAALAPYSAISFGYTNNALCCYRKCNEYNSWAANDNGGCRE